MHYDTNRKAAKILLSGEIDKYQYFRCEKILLYQSRIIEE